MLFIGHENITRIQYEMQLGTQVAQVLLKLRASQWQIVYTEDNFPKHSPF